jgi:hypothetical protein
MTAAWPYIDLKALRMALSNAGIAAPESDEMLAAKLSENLTDLFSVINSRPNGKLKLNAAPVASTLTVINPDEWEPCSPKYLQKHPGACATAPRVWYEERHNHYHPKNWPIAPSLPDEITYMDSPELAEIVIAAKKAGIQGVLGAYAVGWSAYRAVMLAKKSSRPFLPCPICNGVEGCDHTIPERQRASAIQLSDVLKPILAELERAIRKFPTWPTDPIHASKILDEEVGELSKAVLQATYEPHKSGPAEVKAEAIQAAAMAIRFIASLDRYQYAPSAQHEQPALANGDKAVNHD